MDVADDYPNQALAESAKTPEWAYVTLSRRGSFDVEAAKRGASHA